MSLSGEPCNVLGFETPPEIPVEVEDPIYTDEKGNPHYLYSSPMYTALFRGALRLDEVLGLTQFVIGSTNLRVLTAGCSIGAEADTLLAYQNASAGSGRIALKGIDINPVAVEHANRGEYLVPRTLIDGSDINGGILDTSRVLNRLGFVCDAQNAEPSSRISGAQVVKADGYMRASSRAVRKPHTVEFEVADLAEPSTALAGSSNDLVLANNVFYHMSPDNAHLGLRNLASTLTARGVFSFGDMLHYHFSERVMGSGHPYSEKKYGDWLHEAADVLVRDFDFEPALYSEVEYNDEIPIVFQRA